MQLLSLLKDLTLHPKNAKELKGLIVRLALRGNLTEKWRINNPIVENASELLEKLKDGKAHLLESRKMKPNKGKEIQATKDMMYSIPSTWAWYRFSEVAFFQEGPGIRKWQFRESGVKLLNVQNIVGDTLKLENTEKHVERAEFEEKYKHFKVEVGDLLFASSGGSWGKSAWFVDPGYDVMLNTSMVRMCFYDNNWFADYLKTFVSSGLFVDQMTEQLVGIQPNFGSTHLSRIYIPVPPLEEQKAIVEVVNALFIEVEALEELTKERISLKEDFVTSALRRLTETDNTTQEWNYLQQHFSSFFTEKKNIKSLRETILQLAVKGKLTAKWREENPSLENASELLKRIEAEKQQLIAEKKIKKEKPLPIIEDKDKPYNLPESWVLCRLGEIAMFQKGYAFKSANYLDEGIMITKIKNLTDGNTINSVYVDIKRKEEFEQYVLLAKDIVMTTVGSWFSSPVSAVGRSFIISDMFHNSLLNQNAVRIRFWNILEPIFFYSCINTPSFKKYLVEEAQGTANQASITQASIKSFIIGIPPVKEQQAIVEKVNSLMALCDELEQEVDNSQSQIEQLMQSCLKEVFV